MLYKTKRLAQRLIYGRQNELMAEDVSAAREYIAAYWQKLYRIHPKDDESLIGLPKPYLVPAFEKDHPYDFNEFYYWDSYFMVQGMLDEEHKELVLGILEDLLSLVKRFGIIPNASRTYLMGRSQPPVLTSFIFDVFDTYKMDLKWLRSAIDLAKKEYQTVWMGTAKPNWRLVYHGLSRYYDINMLNDLAEAESGWDMTPRFGRKALNYLPVDLNALLYKYETDFARAAKILGKPKEAQQWQTASDQRSGTMDKLMWSKTRGLYFDYNYAKEKRGSVASLASYYPLWAGMVSDNQAKQLVKSLRRFEQRGGLTATDTSPLEQFNQLMPMPGVIPTQWAYPNGWSPLHFLVIKGLQRYGYHKDARRIALKWLKTNLDWFNRHGIFLEKYNVVQPGKPPMKGVYPSQTGFGWTNAVFERFCQEFIDK